VKYGIEGEYYMSFSFAGKVELFKREKGWYYVSVPAELSKPLECLADRGLVAVIASVGDSRWPTSLLPMGDGTHFIALPARVRMLIIRVKVTLTVFGIKKVKMSG